MKMKKRLFPTAVVALGALAVMASCKKEGCSDPAATNYDEKVKEKNDDGSCIYPSVLVDTVYVSENVTANTTWESGKTYILTSRIAVTGGATLTIEPGTVVKGEAGSGANATALIIARGSKIMAEGTASEPIIFTSTADHLVPGEIQSPNLSSDLDGLWGGLIVLGHAQISADAESVQIEGIPVSDPNGLYGGTDNADNSGVISYISIRHGGANIGEGNEINGLTLGGVGSGTQIDHVEIVANQDDGVEFFGGSVSVSDLIVFNNGDDAIDTDQNWIGTLSNFIVINPGDEAMELDGPEGAVLGGNFTITNGSVYMDGGDGIVDNDDNTNVDMSNVYFFGLSSGQDFDQLPTVAYNITNLEAVIPDGDAVADYFKGGSDAMTTSVTAGAQTVGANKAEFDTWSWAALAGMLSDF